MDDDSDDNKKVENSTSIKVKVLPLYSQLSPEKQYKIFKTYGI